MAISNRGGVPPFYVMRVFEAAKLRAAAGFPVYDFTAGQPSTPAPSTVRAAALRCLDESPIGYTTALGLTALRDRIARHYRHTYGVDVDWSDVVITTGSSGGFLLAFLAAFDAGDVVVLARPGYPAYRNILTALGCRIVDLPCGAETGFRLTVSQLEDLDVVPDGVVLASPANPTGSMIPAAELAAVARWCEERGVRLISDEIYHGINYGDSPATAWQFNREAVVVNSFSKYYSMTGWRIGWLLTPPELLDSIDRLTGNFTICPPTLSQHAAIAAFDAYRELDANVARYQANRALLLDQLPMIGLDRLAPADGAFYIYADVSRWTDDTMAWTATMLADCGVAVAPGLDFDPVDGHRFVRLSFAGEEGAIAKGIDVLAEWLAKQPRRN